MNNNLNQNCPYLETKCNDLQCNCAKWKAYLDVQNPLIIDQELKNLNIRTEDKFDKILQIQKHFASRFHPVKNIKKEETDYWVKEYCICTEDEIEELFDYIKLNNSDIVKTDFKELKKEIVDILHFVLDEIIAGEDTSQDIFKRYKEKYLLNNYTTESDPADIMFNNSINLIEYRFDIKRNKEYSDHQQMWNFGKCDHNWNSVLRTLALDLLFVNRELRQQISWKHWKKPNLNINYDALYNVCTELVYKFMLLAAYIFNDADEIVSTYIKKNIENIRRQYYNY